MTAAFCRRRSQAAPSDGLEEDGFSPRSSSSRSISKRHHLQISYRQETKECKVTGRIRKKRDSTNSTVRKKEIYSKTENNIVITHLVDEEQGFLQHSKHRNQTEKQMGLKPHRHEIAHGSDTSKCSGELERSRILYTSLSERKSQSSRTTSKRKRRTG